MKILDRILGGDSEQTVFERGKKIIDHATAANKVLVKMLNGYRGVEEIKKLEEQSDREVFEITNSITSGAIAPNLIDDMIRFIDMEDDIVDTIFNLARAIARYRITNKKVDRYIRGRLLALATLTNSALIVLHEMHKTERIEDARKLRIKIEDIEHRGDDIKDGMLDYAYAAKLDFKSFYYMQNVAFLADDIIDGCEDASDMIVSIMRSILT